MKIITKIVGYIGLSVALLRMPHGQAVTLTELNEHLAQWREKSIANLKKFLEEIKDVPCSDEKIDEANTLLEKYEKSQITCANKEVKAMTIETFGFIPSARETSFSAYQEEKWNEWRSKGKGNPLDVFSTKELSEDELRERNVDIEEIKKLEITSVREITFNSILESDFFGKEQRAQAETWLQSDADLKKEIENYTKHCTFFNMEFLKEFKIKSTFFPKISEDYTEINIAIWPNYSFLVPEAKNNVVAELRQKTELGLKSMLSRKNWKEKVILFLLLDKNTPKNARAKWRYHSDKNKHLGRYTREDNLFSFIDDVDGMKALSHEIGHFLQEHLGFRQTFEDYQTPFAKNLLLLENDYTENDIFNMPQCIQNVLDRFYDHKNIETETEYTPNLEQLSKKTCFEYFQLTARWRKSCEISNMLGVYFKGNTLYINTLSDFPEYNVIFYGHEYKINDESVKKIRSELEDEKTKKAFSDILETTYEKSVPKDMLNLLGRLHKHEKYEKIMCPCDYKNRDDLKGTLDSYGDF